MDENPAEVLQIVRAADRAGVHSLRTIDYYNVASECRCKNTCQVRRFAREYTVVVGPNDAAVHAYIGSDIASVGRKSERG